MRKIIDLWRNYKSIILYVIFGVCTTLINIITYFIFKAIGFNITISSVFSWIISVLFAYITNKIYVFESKKTDFLTVMKEVLTFSSGRIATGILDLVIMIACVEYLHFNEPVVKVASNIIVIILNYIVSKVFVFKNKK